MGLISWDHKCATCEHVTTFLHDRDEVVDSIPCEACGANAQRFYGNVNAAFVNIPQGSNRFQDAKEFEKLKRIERKAARKRDSKELMKIRQEKVRLGRSKAI